MPFFLLYALYIFKYKFDLSNSKNKNERTKEERINEARIIRNFTFTRFEIFVNAFPERIYLSKYKNTYGLKLIYQQNFLFRPIGSLLNNPSNNPKSSNLTWLDLFEVNRRIGIKLRYEQKNNNNNIKKNKKK